MSTIKIRYIETCSKITGKVTNYYIEEKTWFGWKRLKCTVNGYYGSVSYYLRSKDKKTLLLQVLEHKKLCLNFTNIIEYPSIKEY